MRRIGRASVSGVRRVFGAPGLLLGLWWVNVLVALPLAAGLAATLEDHLGRSETAGELVEGFDLVWLGELREARGDDALVGTFEPELAGVGAFLANLDAWWSGALFGQAPVILGAGAVYALLWAFLLGGVLDRLLLPASDDPSRWRTGRSETFFARCGRTFPAFLGIAAAVGVVYFAVFWLARWAFGWLEGVSRDVTQESAVLPWVLGGAGVVALLLCLVRMVSDYAKLSLVLDDSLGSGRGRGLWTVPRALWQGGRFVASHPLSTVGLALVFGLVWVVVLAVYALVAPEMGPSAGWAILAAFLFGQLALVAKLAVRLALLAAEGELYRGG
jgi:hypothetical protein